MKESVDFKLSSEVFTETLNHLIENKSVIVNSFRNHECLSLPKGNFQEIETEKEGITEQFHQIKNDFLDKFSEFKTKFLHEVKSFKDKILHQNTKLNHLNIRYYTKIHRKPGTHNHIIIDIVTFLKDQLRRKDKVIDSLINQFSQQNNYLVHKRNTDNQLERNLESVKSKETEEIKTIANNNKTEDTEDRESEKNPQKQPLVTRKTVNKIFRMKSNLLIDQTAKKI